MNRCSSPPFRGHVSDISVRKFRRHFRLVDVPLEILRNVSFHATMTGDRAFRGTDEDGDKVFVTIVATILGLATRGPASTSPFSLVLLWY